MQTLKSITKPLSHFGVREDIEYIIRLEKQNSDRKDFYFNTRRALLEYKNKELLPKRSSTALYTLWRLELLQNRKSYPHQRYIYSDFDDPTIGEIDTDVTPSEMSDFSQMTYKPDIAEAYSFVGMHHLFERKNCEITCLAFAHNESDKLAFSSSDGIISVCDVGSKPQVIFTLTGHTQSITNFDWSSGNEYIISVSYDKTIRLWDAKIGKCLRVIFEKSPTLSIAFHPLNNNLFVVGLQNSQLKLYNLSTGKLAQKFKLYGAITSLCFTQRGDILFVGDAKSYVYSFKVDIMSGNLMRMTKTRISKGPITSLSFSNYITSARKNTPSLLVNACDNSVRLFHVDLSTRKLTQKAKFAIEQSKEFIRSVFCPLISFKNGAAFVSGSEGSEVFVFDLTKVGHKCLNRLMGHTAPVLNVAWNYNESLLASGDKKGIVILWKRTQFEEDEQTSLIPKGEFDYLKKKLKELHDDDERLNAIKQKIEYLECKFNCNHVIEFLQFFDFPKSKLDLMTVLIPNISDIQNYKKILEKFPPTVDKNTLEDVFKKYIK